MAGKWQDVRLGLRRSREVDHLRSAGVTQARNSVRSVDQEQDRERDAIIDRYVSERVTTRKRPGGATARQGNDSDAGWVSGGARRPAVSPGERGGTGRRS